MLPNFYTIPVDWSGVSLIYSSASCTGMFLFWILGLILTFSFLRFRFEGREVSVGRFLDSSANVASLMSGAAGYSVVELFSSRYCEFFQLLLK